MTTRLNLNNITVKVDIVNDEMKNNPYIIADVLNLYRGQIRNGIYRFLVYGKQSENIYLDETLDVFFELNKKNRDALSSSQFFEANRYDLGYFDSSESVFNSTPEDKTLIITRQTQIDPDFIIQRFRNANIGHCFFNPMIKYFNEHKDSKKTFYKAGLNKINDWNQKSGKVKTGLLTKYKEGVPENVIQEIVDDLKVGVDISQPLNDNIISVRPSNGQTVKKVFRYINTSLNHIDETNKEMSWKNIFIDDRENTIVLSVEQIREKYKELTEKNIPFIYSKDKQTLKTPTEIYSTSNIDHQSFKKFEKDTGLDKVGIYLTEKDHNLKVFLKSAMNYQGTVDFIETENFREKTTQYLKLKGIKHYDQKQAYTQFKQSKYYNGFVGKLTDFRRIDHFKHKGFYRIKNLDISKANEKFQYYEKFMMVFHNNGIYTDSALRFLEDQGATFTTTHGCYGFPFDFEFSNEMLETMVNNKNPDKPIPKYSYYTGMNGKMTERKCFFMNGEKQYFQQMRGDIHYDEFHQRAILWNPKKDIYSRIHISAQITDYQRLNMYEQLLELDHTKLIRVCVDGFYTFEENPKLINKFREKTDKLTFNNYPCIQYSHNINYKDDIIKALPKAKAREHHKTEVWIGQGGNGKTHSNLMDSGFIGVKYIAPSYKLTSTKSKEYNIKGDVLFQFYKGRRSQENYKLVSTAVIDEASMINEEERKYIFKHFQGKVIFCGDIGYQLKPIKGQEININKFDNIIEKKKNYRYEKNDDIRKLVKTLRKMIVQSSGNSNKKVIYRDELIKLLEHFKCDFIKFEELENHYTAKDMIITTTNQRKDLFTEKFKDINKYYIQERKKDLNRGDITEDEKLEVEKELRHGYTIHSIQGETIKSNLFIDINKVMTLRSLYTAVSRVKTIKNIKIII